jgi:transcriptional regulator with XRE-family HTH domain
MGMKTYDAAAHRRAFGDRVRQLRQAHGWTQEDLAERAGLHRTYVTGVERGQRNVSLDAIHLLAIGLAVTPGELFPAD